MKQQQGFAVVIALIVIAVVGVGGYATYKQVQQKKSPIVEMSQTSDTQVGMDSKTVPDQAATPTETKVAATVSSTTSLTCNNWDCFITAAKQCQSASGVVSYNNFNVPILESLRVSGKTKYEIKKSGTACTLTVTRTEQTLSMSAEERAKLIAQGTTNQEIDAQLKGMNEGAQQYLIGKPIVCSAATSAIAVYVQDEKNNTGGNVSFTSKTGMTTYTTTSGEKVSCTNPV